jgi:hypothetical protein
MSPLPNTQGTTPKTQKNIAPVAPAIAPPAEGFREREQTPMKAWDTPGQQTSGYFLGLRPSSKYAGRKILDLVDDDGLVTTWPCPVILEQLLLGVANRAPLVIHYRGEEPNAKGETKLFQVFVGDVK